MWPAERSHFHQNMSFDPYKRRNTGGSMTKNKRRVDFTKIHLHTKFERNPSRNAAVRVHKRMWTKIWPLTLSKTKHRGQHHQELKVCRFDDDAHLYKIWKKSVKKCQWPVRAHTRVPPKYDLWPYKRRNTGGSITKNNRRVDFAMITSIQNMKEIRQEMQLLERTQQCEPKYDLWPYNRRNTGAASPKTIGV